MRTVWKYSVPVNGEATVIPGMDVDHRVVHVACQYGDPRSVEVWIEHDPESLQVRPVTFLVFGTGHQIADGWEHVGSGLAARGELVWHLYRLQMRGEQIGG